MSEKFIFHGQITFIDKPKDTVIQNFQNNYLSGDNSTNDKVNSEIGKLVELVLQSKDLSSEQKEEIAQALHSVAGQVKEEKANKLTVQGTLNAVKDIVAKVSDIATPAIAIISTIFKLLGLS